MQVALSAPLPLNDMVPGQGVRIMLKRISLMIVAAAALDACAAITPPPDTAQLPFSAFGTLDNDVGAANVASWAFASPARTRNDPVDGARAAAAIDFLAGELSSNPRWLTLSPLTKQEMLRARADVRSALGIRQDAPSQIVANALLQFAADWQAGNQPAAMQILTTPVFTLPPQQTLQILANLPYIRSANIASIDAANQMLPGGDFARRN
jgi:hypothetical protein